MSPQHTPGPWFTFANAACVGGPVGVLGNPSGADTAGVAHCGMGLRTGSEVQANARLIAAAPDMLEALRQAKSSLVAFKLMPGPNNAWEDHDEANLKAVDEAIAKATGATP